MKNIVKNRSESDSYTASEAATMLGVSIPTLKRMVTEGRLKGFRTPGGHVRVAAESIEAVREPRSLRSASPVLQNRREQIEETVLEAQALRARRDLAKLEQEQKDESDRREAAAEARRQEAAQRQAELRLERQRLDLQERQEMAREKQRQAEEARRREAERALADFRRRWQEQATKTLSTYPYGWLSQSQRKEVFDGLDTEIKKRQPSEDPIMAVIIARALAALVEPLEAERNAQERRQQVMAEALRRLPYQATEAEQVRAADAIQQALERFDISTDLRALRIAAEEAVRPVCQTVRRRAIDESVLSWTTCQLPSGYTDLDKVQLQRKCSEILADLPLDVSEAEAKNALGGPLSEARSKVNCRLAESNRQVRKRQHLQQATSELSNYRWELYRENKMNQEKLLDFELKAQLEKAVTNNLESNLSGDETPEELRRKVRAIVDGELSDRAEPKAKKHRRTAGRDRWQ